MSKTKLIVCIDDDKLILNRLKIEFVEFDKQYIVKYFNVGQDALNYVIRAKEQNIELVLVIADNIMPNDNGIELLEKIHSIFPLCKKIMLTAYTEVENVADAINKAHLFRYILKPWEKNDFNLTIKEALASYDYMQKIEKQNLELQEKNLELELSKQKILSADKLKTAFLSNISHEIRTPLNGIIGFADLLLLPNLSEEQLKKYIKIIKKSSKQLLQIINDIMDVSKIETGEIDLNITKIDIDDLLNELFELFIPYAQAKFILLKNNNSDKHNNIPNGCNLYSDRTRLKQVLTNLIGNAIKFTNEGVIEFGYFCENEKITFFVKDTGIGIADDKKEFIFKRFSQADSGMNRAYGGTGLGLSICKDLISMLGGEIEYETKQNEYTIFRFYLPLKKVPLTEKKK